MGDKIRVCILTPIHFSSLSGGSEYQAALLADALSRTNKYEVFYVCQRADENYLPEGYRIHVVKISRMPGSFFSFLSAKQIYNELKNINPSIIYQRVGGLYTGIAAYYAKSHDAKLIWQIASDDNVKPQERNSLKRILLSLPERVFLNYGIKNATTICAQTKWQAVHLKRKFGIECQAIIPNGHPVPKEKPIKVETITVLWVANLKPLKRPEIFVRLAKHFQGFKNVRFVMIGRNGWGKWFDKLKNDIHNCHNLEYVGELTQDQVNQYLNRSHILVNTSRFEGFSNTFIQAWMSKVPVVSLAVDPDQILVRKKIGFKSETFEQLCKDIEILINDSAAREKMGDRAYRYAIENHSIEKTAIQAIKMFNQAYNSRF